MAATLKGDRIDGWTHRITGSAIIARWLPPAFQKGIDIDAVDSAIDMPYDIPNLRLEYVRREPPTVPTGFWRGVGPNNNVFAIESFIDELAHKAGKDPVEFRLANLDKTPRLQAAIRTAAQKSGWGGALSARRARGIAAQVAFGSFIATVCEAEVDENGEVKLHRVTCVVDTGIAVNPDTIMAQLQGGIIFGLTAALFGEITIAKGRVQQSNFNDYRMLRINEVPPIAVHVLKSGEAPGGIGEAGCTAGLPLAGQRALCRHGHPAAAHAGGPRCAGGKEKGMTRLRLAILAVGVIGVVGLAVAGWILLGPGPLAFADGSKVALAQYKGADPTGVPAA